jgi:hypothetical protein
MKRTRLVVASVLVIGFGCQPKAAFVSAATQQSDPASLFGPAQTIRIQPLDSTRVRLRLEGRENWIVDSASFSFPRSPSPDFVSVVATPGLITIRTGLASKQYQNFELSIGRSGSLAFSVGADATTRENYPLSDQTIRIEPVDTTHVRLRLVGRDNWIVESARFSLVPDVDFVRVVAAPGRHAVTAHGASRIAETFELSIAPSGSLRFQSVNSPRR